MRSPGDIWQIPEIQAFAPCAKTAGTTDRKFIAQQAASFNSQGVPNTCRLGSIGAATSADFAAEVIVTSARFRGLAWGGGSSPGHPVAPAATFDSGDSTLVWRRSPAEHRIHPPD
jgi:hypothetical protein